MAELADAQDLGSCAARRVGPEFAGCRKTDKTKYELFSDEFPPVFR